MFFIERQLLQNKDTIIPGSFFELVLPMLASAPYAVSIYLYGYYRSLNPDSSDEEINSNEELAEKLGISIDDVYTSWQICEELGLIKKHILDNEVAGRYKIEFRDLRTIGSVKKPAESTTDELIVAYQQEEYKNMYDQIEQAMKTPLTSQDIRKIHNTIKDYNINKNLAVEAVLYSIYKKNTRSVPLAMGVLRNWHLDGIRTVEDLEQMLKGKEQRYLEYKKILQALGEYRGPTEPERSMMDRWLDEYLFDMESITDAIGRTTSIKSPNLNYVDGILKNRLKQIEKIKDSPQMQDMESKETENNFEKRQKILDLIRFTRKTLRRDEMDDLDILSRDFDFSDVEVAYHYLKNNDRENNLSSILRLLNGEDVPQARKNRITLNQVRLAEEHNKQKRQYEKPASKGNVGTRPGGEKEIGPVEKRLQQKRAEQLKKEGKI